MKRINKLIGVCLVAILFLQVFSLVACSDKGSKIPTYTVSVSSTVGGTISASTNNVEQGKDVTFTLTTDSGYVLESLTVNGTKIKVEGNQYVFKETTCNLTVKANFIVPNVVVKFATNVDDVSLANSSAIYGETFGTLPTPTSKGKRFVAWEDVDGNVIRSTSIVNVVGEVTLYANWEDIDLDDENLIEDLTPFSITTAYYDQAATKYGVVFHTYGEPISPSILVAKNGNGDFTNARRIPCSYESWFEEYVINGVVDDLDYATTYSVKLGDYSADVWSDPFIFTTREEVIEEANFIYVTDTQESYLIDNKTDGINDTNWSVVMTDAMKRFDGGVDFIAHGGDIVNHAAEPLYWKEMFGSVDEYLFKYPLMVSPGNHDGDGWYSAGYECIGKMFNIDVISNTEMGFFYSFDYGPLHFVSVLTNDIYYNYDGMYTEEQLNWLHQDLQKAQANPEIKWIIVVSHMGIEIPTSKVGVSNSNDMSAVMYEQLMPILDQYGVALFLYGHNHYLDSTYPMVWNSEVESSVYNDYFGKEINYYKKELATNVTQKTLWDGDPVDEFVYKSSTTNFGCIMHQTGTAGNQYSDNFKLSSSDEYKTTHPLYRKLVGGKKGMINDKANYSMYSYVEVTSDKLVCRTYGVDVASQIASPNLDNAIYIDGFMRSK